MVWLFVFGWLRPVTDWLLGLKWQNVELSQGILSAQRALRVVSGQGYIVAGPRARRADDASP
jgi:hypothetical protein